MTSSHSSLSRILVCALLIGLTVFSVVSLNRPVPSSSVDLASSPAPLEPQERRLAPTTLSSSKPSAGSPFAFKSALKAIDEVANLVYQRFEFHNAERYQFFLGSQNMPAYGWDLIKYKLALKILSQGMKKHGHENTEQQKNYHESTSFNSNADDANATFSKEYLMIFGGSSVTAGHDNYYHQAYPFVFERRLSKIFKAIGLDLVVHNIAQGANNCRPADYCYEAMGGDNADWMSWEQSFNCGRSRDIMEMMARIAYWNKAALYYVASGAFLPSCEKTKDKLYWASEQWTPESENITDRYAVTPEKTTAFRQTSSDWYDDGNAVSRFTVQVYGGIYKGVGPHGYSVWGHSSKLCNNGKGCNAIDMKGDCNERGGPHWMVAETSWYAEDPNRRGKNWHPPAGMHLMRGEVLAYTFAHIVADTIYMLQNDAKTMTKEEMFQKYLTEWSALRVPIPEKGIHMGVEDSQPMKCYTDFRPHFNPKYRLTGIVLGAPQWKYIDRSEIPEHDKALGYNDSRPFFEANAGNKEIHFRIHSVRSGAIRVCGYLHKDSLSHVLFFLDTEFSFPANTPISEIKYEPTAKQVQVTDVGGVGDDCVRLGGIPLGGEYVLTVRTDPAYPTHTSIITHVISF